MAAPEVGGRQRWHEELLVLPVVGRVALDFAAAHRRQLSRLRLHDFASRNVLDGLKRISTEGLHGCGRYVRLSARRGLGFYAF